MTRRLIERSLVGVQRVQLGEVLCNHVAHDYYVVLVFEAIYTVYCR